MPLPPHDAKDMQTSTPKYVQRYADMIALPRHKYGEHMQAYANDAESMPMLFQDGKIINPGMMPLGFWVLLLATRQSPLPGVQLWLRSVSKCVHTINREHGVCAERRMLP